MKEQYGIYSDALVFVQKGRIDIFCDSCKGPVRSWHADNPFLDVGQFMRAYEKHIKVCGD